MKAYIMFVLLGMLALHFDIVPGVFCTGLFLIYAGVLVLVLFNQWHRTS